MTDADGESTIAEAQGEQTETNAWENPDEQRRNRRLDAANLLYVWVVRAAATCGVVLLGIITVGLCMVIITVAVDHTVNDGALSPEQMLRIHEAAIGLRDGLTGSAFISSFILLWLARRGWIIPAGNGKSD